MPDSPVRLPTSGHFYRLDDIIDEHVADRVRTIRRAIRASQKLTAKTGVGVPWRDVLNQDMPKGGQAIDTVEDANSPGGREEDVAG